jgi:hypothetical protein
MGKKSIPVNPDDLTNPSDSENPEGNAPIDTSQSPEGGDLDEKTKAGFQKALQQKAEALKSEQGRRAKIEEELETLRKERKEAKLAELDETERLKIQLNEQVEDNAKLRMTNFASIEIGKRKLSMDDPLCRIAIKRPWALDTIADAIERNFGDSPTWADVIKVVEDKLPSYLDELVSLRGEPKVETEPQPSEEPFSPPVDVERTPSSSSKRTWSRKEIASLSDSDYAKYRGEILLAEKEGRIVS